MTVALNEVPAVAEPGTSEKASWVAVAALTVRVAVAGVRPAAVAVMVFDPEVLRVKFGVLCPLTKAAVAGSVAWVSLEV